MSGYIQYISDLVIKETVENIRNQLAIKISFEKEKRALDKMKEKIRRQISEEQNMTIM